MDTPMPAPPAPSPPRRVSGAPPESPHDLAVVTRHLHKSFDERAAIHDVTMAIGHGTIVGLIGPSGSGKSTLVRTMLGVLEPSSGEVEVFGRNPIGLPLGLRSRMAYMPQMPVLFPNLSVRGNLAFVASLYGVRMRGRRRRLDGLLELVDLAEHRHKRLAECSGGMQRRLALAATLVHDPDLLFLDEPTAGVDPILRDRFWDRFRELRSKGRTIIVPTQYVGEAVSCDMVAIISEGELIAYASPDDLRATAFAGTPFRLELAHGWLPSSGIDQIAALPGVRSVRRMDDELFVVVDDAERTIPLVSGHLQEAGLPAVALEPVVPTFDQVFVELIERHRNDRAPSPVGAT